MIASQPSVQTVSIYLNGRWESAVMFYTEQKVLMTRWF